MLHGSLPKLEKKSGLRAFHRCFLSILVEHNLQLIFVFQKEESIFKSGSGRVVLAAVSM